jgi:sulfite exporter TauE/SafE
MNLAAAFLLGFGGSVHCALMCGPLLLAVGAARRNLPGGPAARGIAYHAGRLFVYCFLGAVSGLIGGAIALAGLQRWISVAAGCVVLGACLFSLRARSAGPIGGIAGKLVFALKTRFGSLLASRAPGSSALLGAINGLLPCGLVYSACAVAVGAGGMLGGIATMFSFGAGTLPMLVAIGLAGKGATWIKPARLRSFVLTCAAVAGMLLIVRGLSLGIPYLSPHYVEGGGPVCACHSVF